MPCDARAPILAARIHGNRIRSTEMRLRTIPAALVVALAATFAATAGPANAGVSSASIDGKTATLNFDAADDTETVSVSSGLLVHTATGGGLNSTSDWDSAKAGDQTVPADGTFTVVINGGGGNDSLTVLAKSTEIADATLNGDGGDDVLTGADTNDGLNGADGNDRLVGAKGTDLMHGDGGNDTLVWNNGDGSDRMVGDTGNDGVEVNGSPTLGDVNTLDPEPGGVKFRRTNLVPFTLDTATERFQVNGLGGNDSVSVSDGVGALTLLSVDGGAGDDAISGSDGPDLLLGGEGNDVLSGRGGDDRVVGDRGNDTMNGGAGDDTLVWNNGDATDVINGDDGRDDVEVNGAPAAGDVVVVQPNGARIKFDRPNLVPFSLDIGSSETMHANGLGGDDAITVGEVGSFAVTASGGPGNDTLTGDGSSETFLGGSGNDTIDPGGGIDVVSADDGDDKVNVRDHTADLASGGAGNDSVVADPGNLDILEGFETIDRTPGVGPPPVVPPVDTSTRPVTIRGGTVKVKRDTASIKVSCPAISPANCTGSLALRTAKRVRVGGRRARVQLGRARYDLAPGSSKRVNVKLAKGSRRLAARNGHLRALAVASTGASGKFAQNSRPLTLVLRTKSR
jgi:Ca2+-binding RTX toxin-like protein